MSERHKILVKLHPKIHLSKGIQIFLVTCSKTRAKIWKRKVISSLVQVEKFLAIKQVSTTSFFFNPISTKRTSKPLQSIWKEMKFSSHVTFKTSWKLRSSKLEIEARLKLSFNFLFLVPLSWCGGKTREISWFSLEFSLGWSRGKTREGFDSFLLSLSRLSYRKGQEGSSTLSSPSRLE